MSGQANPLSGYFRQPAIYLSLPSRGRWWDQGSIDLPSNGEIPVYPMTAKDEIVIRTPDALLNGQGVVDVIQSCCPNIKDAWKMPSVDVDTILISIRIATYGNTMNFNSQCPHCKEMNTYEVDLGGPLSNIPKSDYDDVLEYQDLRIKLKPQQFFNVNKANMLNFEEQRMIEALNDTTLSQEEKSAQITVSMSKIIEMGISGCANSTEYIDLPNGTRVSDVKFIEEFYINAENRVVKLIQERITELVQQSKIPAMHIRCDDCDKEYDSELEFDYANFFAKGF